jgi:hypothetical protein
MDDLLPKKESRPCSGDLEMANKSNTIHCEHAKNLEGIRVQRLILGLVPRGR